MRYKITDIDNESFYQIPKSLNTQKNYKGIGSDAKLIYALLKDRMELSRKNNWKDENGDIYLLFAQEEIGKLLDISVPSVSRAMKKLTEYSLIDIIRQGLNRPNKIYINKVELRDQVEDENIHTPESELQTGEEGREGAKSPDFHICKSGLSHMEIQTFTGENQEFHVRKSRFSHMKANDTDINNNKMNDTDINNNNNHYVDKTVEKSMERENVVVLLKNLGATEENAIKIISAFGIEKVSHQLKILLSKNDVNNGIGWLITALKNNYKQVPVVVSSASGKKSFRKTIDTGRALVEPMSKESILLQKKVEEKIDDYTLKNSDLLQFIPKHLNSNKT